MPNKDSHLTQARHNAAFYQSIDIQKYSDWGATVLFYTGLSYVDAFLATHGIHPATHAKRNGYIHRINVLRRISSHYSALKSSSETARYFPPAMFSVQHLQNLEQTHLEQIRNTLRQYLPI